MDFQTLSLQLQKYLSHVSPTELTHLFIGAITLLFFFALVFGLFGIWRKLTDSAPTLMTSLGILGTFAGIVVGLMHFDPANIDASIPNLLDGMKTAFITSLWGMLLAIIFKLLMITFEGIRWIIGFLWKFFNRLAGRVPLEKANAQTKPEDILRAINEQNKQLNAVRLALTGKTAKSSILGQIQQVQEEQRKQHQELIAEVVRLKTSLSGAEEESLISQIRLLRADEQKNHKQSLYYFMDFREKLWKELDEFSNMLSKSATEQVINALKEVITDFNKNLTEQFGDNFKALDASVKKLVDWQEHYKDQIAQMIRQYEAGVTAISATESSVKTISESSEKIPENMELLKLVLLRNRHQLLHLSKHLKAFQEIRDKAVEAIPEIRAQVDHTVKEMTACVQTTQEHYTQLLDRSDAYIKSHDEQTRALLGTFVETTNKGIESVRCGLEAGATEVQNTLGESAKAMDTRQQATARLLTEQQERLREQFDAHVLELKESTLAMTKNLTTEAKGLSESLKTTGTQVQRDSQAIQERVANSIEQMQKRLESALEAVFEQQAKAVQRSVEGLLSEMGKAVERTGSGVTQQLTAIDQSMQQEVQRVMTEMGQALAQITGQFTSDYRKLVQQMAEIVRAGSDSQR